MLIAAAASASRIIAGLAFVVWHLVLQKVTKSGKQAHWRADGELISHSWQIDSDFETEMFTEDTWERIL